MILELLIRDFLEPYDNVFAVRVSPELHYVLLHVPHYRASLSLITHINDLDGRKGREEEKEEERHGEGKEGGREEEGEGGMEMAKQGWSL